MVSNVQYDPPCTKYHLQGIALILVAGINKDVDINMDVGINMNVGTLYECRQWYRQHNTVGVGICGVDIDN